MPSLLKRFIPLLLPFCLVSPSVNAADDWQALPANPIILTVTGELGCCPQGQALFDLQRLDALPQVEVNTQTPWTEQVDSYQGVRLSVLLNELKAQGQRIDATALNDYSMLLNLQAARKYPVILATRKNGKVMSVRDKGPIWVIYPLNDFPELRKEEHHQAMVWQLKSLNIAR
jgi:hypothetical protein